VSWADASSVLILRKPLDRYLKFVIFGVLIVVSCSIFLERKEKTKAISGEIQKIHEELNAKDNS
jgi:hypothetical protein